MYRYLREALPEDPKFPHDLEKLGYFISETDHIKSIEYPGDDFQFWLTTNERYNDVQREAMHACIRREVSNRLTSLSVPKLYLPSMTTEAPKKASPHLPIHCTPPSLLPTKKRVIVIMNKSFEDLGIWAYRVLSKSGGINAGSCVSFVKDVRRRAEIRARKKAVAAGRDVKKEPATPEEIEAETPGIILLNPGQLLYSYKEGRSMTPMSWDARPRKSAVHPPPKIHPVYNFVPHNGTAAEHADFVFENIVGNADMLSPNSELYLVGVAADGSEEMIKCLSDRVNDGFSYERATAVASDASGKANDDGQDQTRPADKQALRDRVAALALTAPLPINNITGAPIPLDSTNASILQLLADRARAWSPSEHELDTNLENPTPNLGKNVCNAAHSDEARQALAEELNKTATQEGGLFLCPRVSAGSERFDECVMPAAFESILDWFEEVEEAGGCGKYKNPVLDVKPEVVKAKKDRLLTDDMVNWGAWGGDVGGSDDLSRSSPAAGTGDLD